MSSRPWRATMPSTSACTCLRSVTSQLATSQSPPSPSMIFFVSSAAARLISTPTTSAPCRANSVAMALPLPQPGPLEPQPVTSATLPFRLSILRSLVSGSRCAAQLQQPQRRIDQHLAPVLVAHAVAGAHEAAVATRGQPVLDHLAEHGDGVAHAGRRLHIQL